ncbi:MAG: VanZ family protein [Terriglobales bacterium]
MGILVAGLGPFRAPKNEVSWASQANGLLFGRHGGIVSSASFEAAPSQSDGACSLEIWLEPSLSRSSGTILSFYRPSLRVASFGLRQWRSGIVIDRDSDSRVRGKAKTYVGDVLSPLKPVFLAITSGEAGTAIYVNGELFKRIANLTLSSRDLTGQLVIGTAPSKADTWSGQIKGLAVYDRELRPDEVSHHFANWMERGQPVALKKEGTVALYLFNEGKGSIVHNQVDASNDLLIPEHFFVLREQFLERPWDEFRSDKSYLKDVGINIAGFIPLGFFFSAYFSAVGNSKRATWLTIGLGFAVSLTIEVLQAFLPTRDSGMTDLITNTFGTALGALLWSLSARHNWFAESLKFTRAIL